MAKKKCRHCKEWIDSDGGIKVPLGWFCCMDCCVKHSQDARDKQRARQIKKASDGIKMQEKANRKAVRELRNNDRSHQLKLTQAVFNRWIREVRDKDEPCISCGRHHRGQYHAGHYRTVGANPELRFEPLNCWKQCSACNNHLSGNIANYRPRLIERIGLEKVEWLEGPHEPKKYTCEELIKLRAHYSKLIRES